MVETVLVVLELDVHVVQAPERVVDRLAHLPVEGAKHYCLVEGSHFDEVLEDFKDGIRVELLQK